MSLIDALLLEPAPFDVWIAVRTDGVKGSGTLNDPYDGSTETLFDDLMSSLPGNVRFHLGPGLFKTKGFSDSTQISSGWQMKPGMYISGSGVEATTLQIVDRESGTNEAHVWAIGHALTVEAGSPPEDVPNPVDLAEISDLTID
jgi:hypothetical protein